MRSVHGSALASGLAALLAVAMFAGAEACSLSLDQYSNGTPNDDAATPLEGGDEADVGSTTDSTILPIASCAELKLASPQTPDGYQMVDPDGAGPTPPFRAWCDMTTDGGGWMLVTRDLVAEETASFATVTHEVDPHGGMVLRAYVNDFGCGSDSPTRHRFLIKDTPSWTRIRFKQTFAGDASCWHVFGALETNEPLDANLVPFDVNADVVRDAVRMGGSAGDAFDGVAHRCDMMPTNFWYRANGQQLRSATAILRRRDTGAFGGISTGADCGSFGASDQSPTWWEYRDIYVK